MSTVPVETRPSDAERDRALAVLRDGAGSGRLSHDTFIRRMNFVLRAQSRGELADAVRDLPPAESRVARWTRDVRSRVRKLVDRLSGAPRTPVPPTPSLGLPAPGSPTVRIGRGPGATLRLPDISVSRFHAELRHVGDGWMLRDLGSMNGTCVNDLRITTTVRVRPGDRVSFGAVDFNLTWMDQPQ
ncbi:FHA domain-containing protein [Kribbella sp. NPDC004875]|uniref:FHA domain-containing protein n=1 Tax=Kribbella sp. NPDC004875 TaxID=3364107 RepID=UPI00367F941A